MSWDRGIISTYTSGVDVVFEWKIENFFNLPETNGAAYLSPDFSFGGEKWYLGISPNGSSLYDSSGHVDLNLCKWDTDRSIKQSFSLSLKTAEGEIYNEQHFSKEFDNYNYFHELNRVIPRSELRSRRSELVPEDVLTVICTMKGSTSAGSASDTSSAECCHCKGTFNADSLSSHQKKCMHRSIKCPDCLEVVALQKWLEEHECQQERPEGEACASGCSANPHQNKLHYDLKELFLKKEDCDVTIKVEGLEFPALKAILKARSPVFASTFRHNMKENATGILEIKDCDPSAFSDFLCFLYCGDVGIISQENVFGLFTAADKYQVLDLRVKCLEFIKKNLTVDTFCETITLGLQHSETELIKLSTDYFTKNAPKVIVTVKWQTFLAENPTESNELLIKLLVPDSSSSK